MYKDRVITRFWMSCWAISCLTYLLSGWAQPIPEATLRAYIYWHCPWLQYIAILLVALLLGLFYTSSERRLGLLYDSLNRGMSLVCLGWVIYGAISLIPGWRAYSGLASLGRQHHTLTAMTAGYVWCEIKSTSLLLMIQCTLMAAYLFVRFKLRKPE